MTDHESIHSRFQENATFDDGENDECKGSVRVVSGSGFRYVVPFPWRLHQMLEEIEQGGEAQIVSWLPDGQHFQVHNPQLFVQKVIPKFFKQKSYKSFQRQLHLYGFQRETDGHHRGAYFHESFVRNNRQLALEISRIKAPKRRRTPQQSKLDLKSKLETKTPKQSTLSALDRFQSLSDDAQPTPPGPTLSMSVLTSQSKPTFDPLLAFQQSCSCPHRHQSLGLHVCNSGAKPASPAVSETSSGSKDVSVADTYNWLINAGVPFSAFDPVALDPCPVSSSDLYECADEITSLFALHASPKMSSTPAHMSLICNDPLDSPISEPSFGINGEDASLAFPQDMLGELNTAIWGL